VVAVSYELEVEGAIADKATSEKPLEYIQGTGMLIPEFEANIDGKEPGDSFDFILSPEKGYGVKDPSLTIDLPKEAFLGQDGKIMEEVLVPGKIIPMYDNTGHVVQGTVLSVSTDNVKMDFNHPMAGKTLHFTGKVESVRKATEKELAEGLHGEYLPKEDCGCGDCGCHHEGEGCGCNGDGGCHGEGRKKNCDCSK